MKIGTRGSALALWQANAVRDALMQAHGLPEEALEIVVIRTSGDRIQDRALLEAGGKGLFTKEIEEALLSGAIDLAVHSAKDMPTFLPDGLTLGGYLPRADVRDAFISGVAQTVQDLPRNAVVGTASLRREALLKRIRPDIEVKLLRGNVPTRLKRVEDGDFHATLLAAAGLERLGLQAHITSLLDVRSFLPACGQGAVTIECREQDGITRTALDAINHLPTQLAAECERTFLGVLDGSCRTPIGGYASVTADRLSFKGIILSEDGRDFFEVEESGAAADAAEIGRRAGHDIRTRAPREFLEKLGIA
ncbi:hydroxymethylbilane synthase [Faunimonas pinastri]|nr:hydroxymethylbilane synthase [Faunimonas pinastri]